MKETESFRNDSEPFRRPLKLEYKGTISDLKKFENDDRYIVRVEPLTKTHDHKEFREAMERFEVVSGLHYAPYWDLVAKARDETGQVSTSLKNQHGEYNATYRVTKRVEGLSLDDYVKKPDGSIPSDQISKCMEGIAKYWIDSYNERVTFSPEIRPDQFVYGSVEGDKNNKMYMVDLDNLLFAPPSEEEILEVLNDCLAYLVALGEYAPDSSATISIIKNFIANNVSWEDELTDSINQQIHTLTS